MQNKPNGSLLMCFVGCVVKLKYGVLDETAEMSRESQSPLVAVLARPVPVSKRSLAVPGAPIWLP